MSGESMDRLEVGDIVKVRRWGEERLGEVIQIAKPCNADKEHRCFVEFSTRFDEHLNQVDRFYWYDFSKILEVYRKGANDEYILWRL